jgi:hypothetical protein
MSRIARSASNSGQTEQRGKIPWKKRYRQAPWDLSWEEAHQAISLA